MKLISGIYGTICYFVGFAALLALIAFIGEFLSAVTVSRASHVAPAVSGPLAIIWNLMLVALWSSQHSLMADPRFKAVWTKIVPNPVERSSYLVFVALMTAILIAFWVPLPGVIWDLSGSAGAYLLFAGFIVGWIIVFVSTFLIDHFHLFGLKQSWLIKPKQNVGPAHFVTPLFYKLVRHPMMSGVLIALWCAPTLTLARLVFNIAMTAYILVGTRHEEQTLVEELGEEYEAYRRTTAMLVPGVKVGNRSI